MTRCTLIELMAALLATAASAAFYSAEPTAFGWPLTPTDFDYADQKSWPQKYFTCGGQRQSPIDLAIDSKECPVERDGVDGALKSATKYKGVGGNPTVTVSSYLRSAYVSGYFGSLKLKDHAGADVEYEAIQVHLTTPSMHKVNGVEYPAELFVIHRPKGQQDLLRGGVVLSVLFSSDNSGTSDIFSQFGFSNDNAPMAQDEASRWPAPEVVDLRGAVAAALDGPSYQYDGSVPVPPCTENLKWFVLTTPQPLGEQQRAKLESRLRSFGGGTLKRAALPNPVADGTCREISVNDLTLSAPHDQATCAAAAEDGSWVRSAACWSEGLGSEASCLKSPIDIRPADAGREEEPVEATELLSYAEVEDVEVSSGTFTVDAVVGEEEEFGSILVGGRRFSAWKVSVKPISQHSINGVHHHGELTVEHILYGDDFTEDEDDDEDEDGAEILKRHRRLRRRQLQAVPQPDELHRVVVSIPLVLGAESTLLRQLGLGTSQAVALQLGKPYEVESVDLAKGLAGPLAGSWMWYAGGLTEPQCSEWGVRWMVFTTPLEVSLEQLNSLVTQVNGFDSTLLNQPTPSGPYYTEVSNSFVPPLALEPGTDCDPEEPWGYEAPSCWGESYPLCTAGKKQSPINIVTSEVTKVGQDNFLNVTSWRPVSKLRIHNTGHNLQVNNEQIGYVSLIGSDAFPAYYEAAEFGLKMPSEHTIDGKQYAAELQILHKKQKYVRTLEGHADENDILIASVFFDLGEESPLLKQFFLGNATIAPLKWKEATHPIGLLQALGPAIEGDFYRYEGSLTTPDCAEVVKHFVFSTPLSMSKAQFIAYKKMFPNPSNNRPLQPLNGREVVKNSFEQPELAKFDFYLNRHLGRDRRRYGEGWILIPAVMGLILMGTVWFFVFVREDSRRMRESDGGLVDTIGNQPVQTV